jgi:hypothetical protein
VELPNEVSEVLEAMAAVEPKAATEALDRLTADLETHGVNGVDPLEMWASFKRVLRRRGFFVSTPAETAVSLAEIKAVGPGFDLFDLARGLAQFDALRMEHLGRTGQRMLPEIQSFWPSPTPRKHRKDR